MELEGQDCEEGFEEVSIPSAHCWTDQVCLSERMVKRMEENLARFDPYSLYLKKVAEQRTATNQDTSSDETWINTRQNENSSFDESEESEESSHQSSEQPVAGMSLWRFEFNRRPALKTFAHIKRLRDKRLNWYIETPEEENLSNPDSEIIEPTRPISSFWDSTSKRVNLLAELRTLENSYKFERLETNNWRVGDEPLDEFWIKKFQGSNGRYLVMSWNTAILSNATESTGF